MAANLNIYIQAFGKNDSNLDNMRLEAIANRLLPLRTRVHHVATPSFPDSEHGYATIASLQTALSNFKRDHAPGEPWLHVQIANTLSERRSLFGATFDAIAGNEFDRRGCALFTKRISEEGLPQLLERTLMHELGHVLNLDHADADGGSLMRSYPPNPVEMNWSKVSKSHLKRHGPQHVLPGRSSFGCPVTSIGTRHPERSPPPPILGSRSGLSVKLEALRNQSGYSRRPLRAVLGEPLFVRTTVRNGSTRTLGGLPSGNMNNLDVRIRVEHEGALRDLPADLCGCGPQPVSMPPKSTLIVDETVFHRGTYMFPHPGRYELRAILVRPRGKPISSQPLKVRIEEPTDAPHVDAYNSALHPELARVFEHGLDLSDRKVLNRVRRVLAGLPTSSGLRHLGELTLVREQARRCLDSRQRPSTRRALAASSRKLASNRWAAPHIRHQALLWASRVAHAYGDTADAARVLARCERLPQPDSALRDRLNRQRSRFLS